MVKSLRDLCCHHLSTILHLKTWHCLSAYHCSRPTRPLINMQLVNCDVVVGKEWPRICCHLSRCDWTGAGPHRSLSTEQTIILFFGLFFFVILLRAEESNFFLSFCLISFSGFLLPFNHQQPPNMCYILGIARIKCEEQTIKFCSYHNLPTASLPTAQQTTASTKMNKTITCTHIDILKVQEV